jgi:hypothetical protein
MYEYVLYTTSIRVYLVLIFLCITLCNFQKGGKAIGELKPPKLKEYDAEKSYVQRPSAKGEDNSIPGTTAGNKPNKHRRAF